MAVGWDMGGTYMPVVEAPSQLLSLSMAEGNGIWKADLIEVNSNIWLKVNDWLLLLFYFVCF